MAKTLLVKKAKEEKDPLKALIEESKTRMDAILFGDVIKYQDEVPG